MGEALAVSGGSRRFGRSADHADSLEERFASVRSFSEALARPLEIEDYVIQSMPDASPTKWHLAHTTWFFETFVLLPSSQTYRASRPDFQYLFNSYYNAVGDRLPRSQRGGLSRPTVREVLEYRQVVDEAMTALLHDASPDVQRVTELGLHHEQQHQELMLTDILHVFWSNPLRPAYVARPLERSRPSHSACDWIATPGGRTTIGWQSDAFCFDNERPVHEVLLEPFEIASRLVTNREYLHFMHDGGYRQPTLWLSDGWDSVQRELWNAPLYWESRDEAWQQMTLRGMQPLDLDAPVCHVSFYEADAYARWAGARLATEFEWEAVARALPPEGNFVESDALCPAAAHGPGPVRQLFGDVWEWTGSSYRPYPRYRPHRGALGEYNGKFMCNQFVLRGGSCATSITHIRPTYRNFFAPDKRWQFSGIRLARDAADSNHAR